MQSHEDVTNAIAILIDSDLWGFVTPSTAPLPAVRAATARSQPYYAVPSQYLALDAFPLTKNGKVDKRRIKEMALQAKNREPGSPGRLDVVAEERARRALVAAQAVAAKEQPANATDDAHANANANANAMGKAVEEKTANTLQPPHVPRRRSPLSLPAPVALTVGAHHQHHQQHQAQRMSVQNHGVPFDASLPGTPASMYDPPASEWSTTAFPPPPSPSARSSFSTRSSSSSSASASASGSPPKAGTPSPLAFALAHGSVNVGGGASVGGGVGSAKASPTVGSFFESASGSGASSVTGPMTPYTDSDEERELIAGSAGAVVVVSPTSTEVDGLLDDHQGDVVKEVGSRFARVGVQIVHTGHDAL